MARSGPRDRDELVQLAAPGRHAMLQRPPRGRACHGRAAPQSKHAQTPGGRHAGTCCKATSTAPKKGATLTPLTTAAPPSMLLLRGGAGAHIAP